MIYEISRCHNRRMVKNVANLFCTSFICLWKLLQKNLASKTTLTSWVFLSHVLHTKLCINDIFFSNDSSKCWRDSINEVNWWLADERELVYRRRCVPILQDIRPFWRGYLSIICAGRVVFILGTVRLSSLLHEKICIAKFANSWHSLVCFELRICCEMRRHL